MIGILLVLAAVSGSFVNGRVLNFQLTARCLLDKTWCLRQAVIEIDFMYDDSIGSSGTVCGKGQLQSTFTVDADWDGHFDNYYELIGKVLHDCTDDNTILRRSMQLTAFNGEKSESNHESVGVDGGPIDIIYNAGDVYNHGLKVSSFYNVVIDKKKRDAETDKESYLESFLKFE